MLEFNISDLHNLNDIYNSGRYTQPCLIWRCGYLSKHVQRCTTHIPYKHQFLRLHSDQDRSRSLDNNICIYQYTRDL